ncbi:MAG: hypothetical protein JWM95_2102 [Gemmatimonadetes bacterium]|nr:hypothetical protein [Gemmatimonadota bacterium]
MRRSTLLFLLAAGLTGCRDSVAPSLTLIGEWAAAPDMSQADGSVYQVTLSLREDQTFVRDWRAYLPASGGVRGAVFAYATTEGTYTVRGDSLFMRAVTNRSWDRDFYGGAVIVTQVNNVDIHGDGARYEFVGERLTLHYLSYPADAPVETAETFFRLGEL